MAELKTRFPIDMVVDGESFDITVRQMNRQEQVQFKKKAKKHTKTEEENDLLRSQYQKKMRELGSKRAELQDNIELSRLEDDPETKRGFIKERSKLREQIAELEKETDTFTLPDASGVFDIVEQAAKDQYDLLVTGPDKERLAKHIEELGVSYADLWDVLNQNIAAARKKK